MVPSVSSFLPCIQPRDKASAVTQPTGRRRLLAARVLTVLGTQDNTELGVTLSLVGLPLHPSNHPSTSFLPNTLHLSYLTLGYLARIGYHVWGQHKAVSFLLPPHPVPTDPPLPSFGV